MIDVRPVFFIIGWLLVMLAGAMLLPAAVEAGRPESETTVFLVGAAITLFVGGLLVAVCRSARPNSQLNRYLNLRQSFLMAVLSWVVLAGFAALPLMFSGIDLDVTDAMFEAVSGITTTGSTVLTGLDTTAPGILLWRALLQWLGGMGIIVTAIAVSPLLRVGGMQIFRIESSDRSEKVLPRAAQIAGHIGIIYIVMTTVLTGVLFAAGLGIFDAVIHAMTTIATGGFSTMDGSVGQFRNPTVEWIVIAGMIAGSLPFVLYIQLMRGRGVRLLADSQVRAFLGILVVAIAVLTAAHAAVNAVDPLVALRQAAFNATSYMTGTGYVTADFAAWGGFAPATLFCLMFIGGCAGSTTCGIKVFRLQVLFAEARAQFGRLLHPARRLCPPLRRKADPQYGRGLGDELRVPVHYRICGDHRGARHCRAGPGNGRVRRRYGDFQCRARARRHHRPERQFLVAQRRRQMGADLRHAARPPRSAERAPPLHTPLLAVVRWSCRMSYAHSSYRCRKRTLDSAVRPRGRCQRRIESLNCKTREHWEYSHGRKIECFDRSGKVRGNDSSRH